MHPLCETAKQVLKKAGFTAYSGLSARVPPDHTRIRKAVSGAFTPRRYRALAPLVRDTVRAMLDAMLAKPRGDLVADQSWLRSVSGLEDMFYINRDELRQVLFDHASAWAVGVEPVGPSYWPGEIARRRKIVPLEPGFRIAGVSS